MSSIAISIYSKFRNTCWRHSEKKNRDTTLILNGSEESFLESVILIEIFGNISGLRLNIKKREALWIGSKKDCDLKVLPEKDFKWPKKIVKALAVWLSTDPDIIISFNYNEKIEKIWSILEWRKFRRLTLLGKIAVLKSLVASQLVYIQLFRERLSEKICARDNPER